MSSTAGLNICATIARIRKYKSIIKKKKTKDDELTLPAKSNRYRIAENVQKMQKVKI